ncbi:MAG: ABC transporter ATP-binding protein [Deltaproteobacteria bacterium]|nr:ABC transporter ATP-binding protein [Deltaproteobacteria bacterium]
MDLILENVSCGYGSKVILAGVNATIPQGQAFGLLGPNGIGKTTLFKAILGFLPLMAGRVRLDSADLKSLSRSARARLMAYVPQAQFTPFAFRVLDVVLMGRAAYMGFWGRPGRADLRAADISLARMGIDFLRERPFTELSGGEKQLVLIARALAQEPRFLMMDEPTSNLDFGNQVKVLKIIRDLAKAGLGVVLTTHYPDHVFQCASQAGLLLPNGNLIVGPYESVLTSENLSAAYGAPVSVLKWPGAGEDFRVCRPGYF